MKRMWYALVLAALAGWGAAGCDESNPGGGGLAVKPARACRGVMRCSGRRGTRKTSSPSS